MPRQQDFVRITRLKRNANNTWTFRIDLDSIHAKFVENFMHELAKAEIFRGGWFIGNWWFDDEGMELVKYLIGNWEEMKARALATEGMVEAAPSLLASGKEEDA